MSCIQKCELRERDAVAYMLSKIDADGGSLSSIVSAEIRDGSFFVFAPCGTTYERSTQLSTGGLVEAPSQFRQPSERVVAVRNLAGELAKFLCGLAEELSTPTAFIREPYLRPGDKSEILWSLRAIDSGLYKVLDLSNRDERNLQSEIRLFEVSWNFFLILSSVAQDEENLTMIISNAAAIVVNAYDGESYLCWKRRSRSK